MHVMPNAVMRVGCNDMHDYESDGLPPCQNDGIINTLKTCRLAGF